MNGGGGIKWGDQAGWNVAALGDITGAHYNVAAVGVPGWDSAAGNANRDRGTALLFNGVAAVHVAAAGRRHGAGHALTHARHPERQPRLVHPGRRGRVLEHMTATVISTAGDAALSVSDPSPNATGHLVNGTFVMPQALQVRANTAAFAPLGTGPLTLLTYAAPVSNDAVTIGFRQNVAANDALRTGSYSKTLTFTLSTTTP